RTRARGQGLCIHSGAAVCDSGRREGDRAGRVAPSPGPQLRSGGRAGHGGRDRRADSGSGGRSVAMFFRPRKPHFRVPLPLRVRDLEILSARLIRAGFAGDYHSAFHGRGIEFSQVREYQPGDDIRTIDWNVTARSGVPHVKEFIEERDLTVIMAIDVSGSMGFGSIDWRKCDIAAELAAVFAFSAVQNSDRIGLLLFSTAARVFIPPRRGRAHAQVIVRAAVDAAMRGPRGVAGFEGAGRFLERVNAKRAVVIVLSDFLDLNFERALKRLNRRHAVVAI